MLGSALGISFVFLISSPAEAGTSSGSKPSILPKALIYSRDWGSEQDELFAAFHAWTQAYIDGIDAKKRLTADFMAQGVALAKGRRAAYAKLIASDPQMAIDLYVPDWVRQRLPEDINRELEMRTVGIGDLTVNQSLSSSNESGAPDQIDRFVRIQNQVYRAYTYGRRQWETTKRDIPLHGVVLDNVMAVHEGSLWERDSSEIAGQTGLAIIGSTFPSSKAFANFGETIVGFPSHDRLVQAETEIEAAEARLGPRTGKSISDIVGTAHSHSRIPSREDSNPWTLGLKQVLIIRVDFSDVPGEPVDGYGTAFTSDAAVHLIDATANGFFQEVSYYNTSLAGVATAVFRMPETADTYAHELGPFVLHEDAESAAVAAGYVMEDYDRIAVAFSNITPPGYSYIYWRGYAEIGGESLWLNGSFDPALVEHELGHTYGLFHANGWLASDGTVIGPGDSLEYLDGYDTMGYSPILAEDDHRRHFNPWFKNQLGWLDETHVQTVTETGTYRLYAFDHTENSGLEAIKVSKSETQDYWIGFRSQFVDDANMLNGAYLIWGYSTNQASNLLDNTPTDIGDFTNVALEVGETLSDDEAGVHITTVGRGGDSPDEFLDVNVTVGFFLTNQRPTATIASESDAKVGIPVVLTVNAVDNDGDPLAYFWDLGDGLYYPNVDSVSAIWTAPGTYTVMCTVSDMKGGTVTASANILVTKPAPVIISPPAATATVGVPFSFQIVATNVPTSFGATNLPAGLSVNTSLGILTGIPTAAGTKLVNLTASNEGGAGSAVFSMTVEEEGSANRIVIVNYGPDTARSYQPFNLQILASGISSDATFGAEGLPAGLEIDPRTGVISGSATEEGSFAVTITVDDGGKNAIFTLQLTFSSDPGFPVIVSPDTATLAAGEPFSYTIEAPVTVDPDDPDPTVFSVIGELPRGLSLEPTMGIISGTYYPTAKRDGNALSGDEPSVPSKSVVGIVQLFATNSHGTATKPLVFLQVVPQFLNISTRMQVLTDDKVLIGGFIVTGNASKKVILRGIGPSLTSFGLTDALADPVLELHMPDTTVLTNDDWKETQQTEIEATGLAPGGDKESAIVATLAPGAYTAILSGKDGGTGIGLVEAYDLDQAADSTLANISTRGFVDTDDNVMIGGLIVLGKDPARTIVRAIGPTLANFGVAGALADPTLELHDGNGAITATNDNWRDTQESEIEATMIAPSNDAEAAIVATLSPGAYTAIVRGKDNTTGVALVEAYQLDN